MISTREGGSEATAAVSTGTIENVRVTTDSKGRLRISREQRRALLAEYERSGVSAAQFAKVTGLKYSTLAGWLQRCRPGRRAKRREPMRLLEAVVESGVTGPAEAVLVLHLGGTAKMELNDLKQMPLAAALIRALAQPC